MHSVPAAGVEIPAIGFGTWQIANPDAARMVEAALKIGYRHIDTARVYRNEEGVGEGLRHGGVARGDYFLTTKIWTDDFKDGDLQRAAEASIKRLGVDQVDLLLLHWPNPAVPLRETIKALNAVKTAGLTRAIGVSNFTSALVEQAVSLSDAPLATDQVEYHPYLKQTAVKAALARNGMALTAYSPLAQGAILNDPVLKAIGEAHGKSVTQIALRWLVQQPGVVAIPKTLSAERAAQNLAIFDFALSDAESAQIAALARPNGRTADFAGLSPEWDKD
ncbi:MAG: 2,5-didehydrogluconate reductase [Caulobacterales bacterium 68-7]|nr:MAG: 2,5-didehydrogluconate reductase [Caulobacterales bacterium 68-7]